MSDIQTRRERREHAREQRHQRHRPAPPRRTKSRSGLWVGLGIAAVLALLVVGARYAGVFEPGVPPVNINDAKYDPAGQVVGTQHPDEGNAHLQPGERGSYGTIPPTSGAHWGAPAAPATWGIKESEVPDEVTTHNLEHGGLVISYKALSAEDTAKLKDLVRLLLQNGYPKIILQPYSKMNDARIALSAWRWQLKLATYEDVPIVQFVRAHYQGPDAPERLVR